MTLEERVARLEQRALDLQRIEQRLGHIEDAVVGLRTDFDTFHVEQTAMLERIVSTLDSHDRTLREIVTVLPTLGFRWPWERRP